MRVFVCLTVLSGLVAIGAGYPQAGGQSVDPAYLRQYYAHLAQANREGGGASEATAAPIYEQEQSQGYSSPQIRQYQSQAAPQPTQYVHQQPQVQSYKPSSASVKQAARRPAFSAEEQRIKEDEGDYDINASYQFGFDVKDDEFTNYQNRKEVRDGGIIKGSYSVVDSDGFIRTVTYTADPKEGFKAEVVREPTDIVVKIPPQQNQELRHQNHQYPQQYKQQPQQQQQSQKQQSPQQYQYE